MLFFVILDHRELCIDDLINKNAEFQNKNNRLNARFSIAETLYHSDFPIHSLQPTTISEEKFTQKSVDLKANNHKFEKIPPPRTATPLTFNNYTSSDPEKDQDSDFVSVPTPRMIGQPVFAKTPRIGTKVAKDAGIEMNTDEDNLDEISSGKCHTEKNVHARCIISFFNIGFSLYTYAWARQRDYK